MRRRTLYYLRLNKFIFFIPLFTSMALILISCDESSQNEEGKKEEAALTESMEEAEGLEGAKEAMKKKGEEDAKESEERKAKREETKMGGESSSKSSQGFKRR